MKSVRYFTIALLMLASFIAGGVYLPQYQGVLFQREANTLFPTGELINTYRFLQKNYLYPDKIDESMQEVGAIQGLVASLDDPYTVYFSKDEYQEFEQSLEGSFEGIGAEIGLRDSIVTVVSPLEGSPASKAGLLPGDKILAIDEVSTQGFSVEEAVSKIRGKKGTIVILTVKRNDNPNPIEISIERDVIDIPNITTEVIDGVGVISIAQFQQDTATQLNTELDKLKEQQITQIVLDLRFNPGGYLQSAVDVVELFADKGSIAVIEKAREESDTIELRTRKNPQYKDMTVVVLVNEGSASASEITAGALRDLNNITLIGQKTFGKGVVQSIQEFSNGSVLKYTSAEWLTPKGQAINKQGLEPDIVVEMTTEDYENDRDPQLDRAIQELKKISKK